VTGRPGEASLAARVAAALRDVPDFPRPGILFKDITPVLANALLFTEVTAAMAAPFRDDGITHVVGIESRGFIFGAPVAQALSAGFIPVRKPGKLPWRTLGQEYALEYGTDRLEMHADAVGPGARVLVVDDVLATGGTAAAAVALVRTGGGVVVGCSFVYAIGMLKGRERLDGVKIEVVVEG
jgi:adenine phosphoribosyltransferase